MMSLEVEIHKTDNIKACEGFKKTILQGGKIACRQFLNVESNDSWNYKESNSILWDGAQVVIRDKLIQCFVKHSQQNRMQK